LGHLIDKSQAKGIPALASISVKPDKLCFSLQHDTLSLLTWVKLKDYLDQRSQLPTTHKLSKNTTKLDLSSACHPKQNTKHYPT